MKKLLIVLTLSILILNFCSSIAQDTVKTDSFSFIFEGKRLKGNIAMPSNKTVKSLILIVPGDGKTNLKWYRDIRKHFAEIGIASCQWDKMGCGESEGEYHRQTVQNSALEVLSAIKELKQRKIPGSEKIGLWGISRAGWICPLVIRECPVSYWISVSGTDDKENFGYLLESHLRIIGRSKEEIKVLVGEWFRGGEIFRNGGSPDEFLEATRHLQTDSFCIKQFGYGKFNPEEFKKNQENYQKEPPQLYDKETGLMIYVPNFENILNSITCPVLAIFGEKDRNVDWRKTLALYKKTIGANKKTTLTIKTFPDGDHGVLKCRTGAMNEDLSEWNWQACDGYYETMTNWLLENGFGGK